MLPYPLNFSLLEAKHSGLHRVLTRNRCHSSNQRARYKTTRATIGRIYNESERWNALVGTKKYKFVRSQNFCEHFRQLEEYTVYLQNIYKIMYRTGLILKTPRQTTGSKLTVDSQRDFVAVAHCWQ